MQEIVVLPESVYRMERKDRVAYIRSDAWDFMGPDRIITEGSLRICTLDKVIKQSEIFHSEYRG